MTTTRGRVRDHYGAPGAHRVGSLTVTTQTLRALGRAGMELRARGVRSADDFARCAPAALDGVVAPALLAKIRTAVREGSEEVIAALFPPPSATTGTALCHYCGRMQPEESFMNPATGVRSTTCTPCRMAAITAKSRHYEIPDDDPSHANGLVTTVAATVAATEEDAMPPTTTNGHTPHVAVPAASAASREDTLALAYLIVESDQKITAARARLEEARAELEAAVAARDAALEMLARPPGAANG